ncbi:MAG: enoyl-CoA hydratase [Marmoricola sp.]|nr:enoyl-CoA hydratase [Marmoricola sp.]
MNTLTVEQQGRVVVVTLDRPPVNAVSQEMQHELHDTFTAFTEDRSVSAVVLAGAGDRAFCGGIDLKEVSQSSEQGSVQTLINPGWQWRMTQHVIRHSAVPVIAAVERPAIGAGFGLVGVCDLIIASQTASFALTEINVGLLGGASKALRLLGPNKARMMMYTGRHQSADEMHRLGAVEQVVPEGEALAAAMQIAQEIASKSPLAIRLAKESIVRIESDEMETQYRTEWDYTNRLRGFNDSREAMRSYIEKREPEWSWS